MGVAYRNRRRLCQTFLPHEWQTDQDLNLDKLNQNQLCYHYTIGLLRAIKLSSEVSSSLHSETKVEKNDILSDLLSVGVPHGKSLLIRIEKRVGIWHFTVYRDSL